MQNGYGTLTDNWKIELIKDLAKQEGLREDEIEDVLQELVPIIADFKFEPEKSNGATEETVVEAVIRKRLKFMLRCRARRQKHEARYRLLHGATDEKPAPEAHEPGAERATGMAIDVREAVARLTPQEQSICAALADGQTRRMIVKETGISRYELDQIITRIGEQFRSQDLDAWMQK